MVNTTSSVSSLQRKSIHTLWLDYNLESDGTSVTIGGDLSLVIRDAGQNADYRHHLKMAIGVKPDVLQALIREFEIELSSIKYDPTEALISLDLVNNLTMPIVPSPQNALATGSLEQAINTCTERLSTPSLTTLPLPTTGKRPAKRSRLREDGDGKVKCPGSKGQGECSKDSKKRWGQIHKFKEHFADEHVPSYEEEDGYRCVCGQTFIKKQSGIAAFAKHVWDNPHTEE